MNSSKTNSDLEAINKNENEIDNVVTYKDYNSKNQNEKTLQCSENNILNINSDNEKPFINWLKKNLKIIIIVCSILITLTVILLIIFLTKKGDDSSLDKLKSSSNNHSSSSNNHSSNSINSDDSSSNINIEEEKEEEEEEQYVILPTKEKIVTKLNYYTNEMFIYKEISNSTMKYSFDSDSSLRTLSETVNTIKNYKYLSFVYDISNTTDGIEKYSAFFTILEKSTEENGEDISYDFYNNFIDEFIDDSMIENSDSSEINEDFSIKPILKAIFYQNGTIEDIFYPEGVNEELKVNVVNFIEKITPTLSAKNYTKNKLRLLEDSDDNKHIFTSEKNKKDNTTKINENLSEKNKDFGTFLIEDSKIKSNIERFINSESKIGKITSNSETNLISNISNQMEKPNFGGLIDLEEDSGDENNIIKFPLNSISTNNSESMELIKNCKNETLKDFIEEKIKNYNYISTKQEKNNENLNLRRLAKIFNVNENEIQLLNNLNNSNYLNINNIRNLVEEDEYEVLQQKIIYAYSLAKTNVAGLKFEIMVIMSFSPQNGIIKFQVVCRTDKAQLNIGKPYEIKTNYGDLINVISKITDIFNAKIIEFKNIFIDKLNNKWKKNIFENLKNLANTIKDPYNMIDIFSLPLSELYNNIRSISLDNFSGVKKGIDIADENITLITEEINNESETNTQKILSYSNSDFSTFIDNTDEKFYDFHENVLELINDINNNLEDVSSIDIDCYYRIIEILKETLYEYENFSNKILSSISNNKENFISYSNNYKDNKLEIVLNEIEHIANRLNTNETLKESIKEEDRIKMIKSLNNYRKAIDEILNLITDETNKNSKFNQVLNNIKTNLDEFKESQNELLAKVRNFMNLNDNFEIYVKHLSLLDSIHEKCEFNRIKLMSVCFTYPISNLDDTYLNENLIDNLSKNLDTIKILSQILY